MTKAIRFDRLGGPDVLRFEDVAERQPGAGEVLLRVRASSINPVDYKFARDGTGLAMPHVLGIDAAGEICCVLRVVMVAYDDSTASAVEIPQSVRHVLEAAHQRAAITSQESPT